MTVEINRRVEIGMDCLTPAQRETIRAAFADWDAWVASHPVLDRGRYRIVDLIDGLVAAYTSGPDGIRIEDIVRRETLESLSGGAG